MYEKYKGFLWGAVAVMGVAALFTLLNSGSGQGGVVQNAPTYATASSTLYTVGDDISTKVLDAYSRRAYARLCNNSSERMFVVLGSTAVTATTSADQPLDANECYEVQRDYLYTGEVQVITNTSTTTDLFVSELRD